jgi:hypothetical protein
MRRSPVDSRSGRRWVGRLALPHQVIPVKAGIHLRTAGTASKQRWMPAFVGMTSRFRKKAAARFEWIFLLPFTRH